MGHQRGALSLSAAVAALALAIGTPATTTSATGYVLFAASQAGAEKADLFEEIYRRGQPLEASLKTIRARFVETTTSSLLVKPLVAEGTLIVVRPSDILLAYEKPERRFLRLDANSLLLVWPDKGLRERKDIRAAQERVQRYFVNKDPSELRRHFTIVAAEDASRRGTWRIEMTPTRKQIRQGLEKLELWVRQDTLLLSEMTMTFAGGDVKNMVFRDVVINEPVSPDELDVAKLEGR
ncbi:MAG TPA: outer membrane lipoprotein carrier protein LolA [Vicinamibacterales bacterium]